MEQFDRKPTVENCKSELEEVAKELCLPLEDPKVPVEWCKRGGWYNDEVAEKLILPLYFPKPEFEIVKDEDGHPVAREARIIKPF